MWFLQPIKTEKKKCNGVGIHKYQIDVSKGNVNIYCQSNHIHTMTPLVYSQDGQGIKLFIFCPLDKKHPSTT